MIAQLGLGGKNPQVYSLGLKQAIKLPKEANRFGPNRVLHTIGYPNKFDVFGGGFLYDMGEDMVSLGLVVGLDWRYHDLNPQQELELLKSHPFIASLLEGGEVVAAGAKTIPEGGFYSMPTPFAAGMLMVGDAVGLVNMKKLKGIHLAVRSGIAAGNTIAQCLASGDFSREARGRVPGQLEITGVLPEMRTARKHAAGLRHAAWAFPWCAAFDAPEPAAAAIPHRGRPIQAPQDEHPPALPGPDGPQDVRGLSGAMHEEELALTSASLTHNSAGSASRSLAGRACASAPARSTPPATTAASPPSPSAPADCMHCKTSRSSARETTSSGKRPREGTGRSSGECKGEEMTNDPMTQ